MDQEEIKKSLRHSFTSAQPDEVVKITKNQFGHTVLGESKEHDTSILSFEQDEQGTLKASFDLRELANHPELQKFHKISNIEPEPVKEISPVPASVNISSLISELDEMDGTADRKQNEKHQIKRCANENCLYALPKDATFCLKCGTYQAPKFCTECGYKFPGMEKFCPDCGNKR